MKKMIFAALLLSVSFFASAQENEDEYELRAGEQQGYIINKDDQKLEGIVKLVGKADNPWMNQKKVKFIAKDAINPEKKRQKFKVMDAGDIKEYVAIDDNGVERHFRTIKFTNKREGFGNSGGLGGDIKTIKNLASTTHLCEVVVDGPITLYRLYGYPTPVAIGGGDVAAAEADHKNLLENPNILFQKGKDKPKELKASDIKELVEDCKAVSEKLASGGFASYDPAKEEKKKSGFGKLIKSEMDRSGDKLLNMGKEIFTEYNSTCPDNK
jgi:hypothetical protein